MIIVTSSFSKSSVFKMFPIHVKTKSRRLQTFSGLKSILAKLRFGDRFVWTVGPTMKLKQYCDFNFFLCSVHAACIADSKENLK